MILLYFSVISVSRGSEEGILEKEGEQKERARVHKCWLCEFYEIWKAGVNFIIILLSAFAPIYVCISFWRLV